MNFKTILVHLNHERRAHELIEAAARIARPTSAHVIGLYVMPPVLIPADIVIPISNDMIEEQMKEHRAQAARIEAIFEKQIYGEPFVAEWRIHNGPNTAMSAIANGVIAEARTVDLVIVSQALSDRDVLTLVDVPERVALESGRPVLVVPGNGPVKQLGDTVAVAWNDTRESARAAFDAMPILTQAKRVRLITVVGRKQSTERTNMIPGSEVAATLARHGINVAVETVADTGGGTGRTLLESLAKDGADVLVMGAYGHSRFREFILGGATRDVLRNMNVPIFMAH